MAYLEFEIAVDPIEPYRDMLLYYLNDIGFETHVETESGLISYINEKTFDRSLFNQAIDMPEARIEFVEKKVEEENWNELWEKSFDPVWINPSCVICASFHDVPDVDYKLLINPKMAFGTGHHETTFLISEHLFNEEVKDKSVLDMGCGTAILAILCKKMGAGITVGIDTDDWAVENARENVVLNGCDDIQIEKGDSAVLGDRTYNLILANINKNVLLSEMEAYAKALTHNGTIIFSGFYSADAKDIINHANTFGLTFDIQKSKNDWTLVKMTKS